MPMATSCSHWWHCPFYFAMAVTLAVISIYASMPPPHNNSNPTAAAAIHNRLAFNASRALRNHGFTAMATILQIYPEQFLSSPQSTIFALQDAAISNLSAHPNAVKRLLQYHTSPSNLPIKELLKKPQGTCLPTLVPGKRIAMTKNDAKKGSVEINDVLIAHPDVFLDGAISIHGVLGPFSRPELHETDQDWEITEPPVCDSHCGILSNSSKISDEWTRTVRFLSSNGFVSFAIGLHSLLDGILQDYPDLNSATIFAPVEFVSVASSRPLLDAIVRFHILPKRLTFMELTSLPEKASLWTLLLNRNLVITSSASSKQVLAINGVKITAPDAFSSEHFVIHGISRAFSTETLFKISE